MNCSLKIHNVLGICSAVTITLKQNLWKSELDKNEQVTENFKAIWINVEGD